MVKNTSSPETYISDYVPVIIISLVGFLAVGYLTLFSFAEGSPVIVISSPWVSEQQAITTALTPASRLIRSDFNGAFVMVMPDQPDYSSKVRKLGAWAVVSSFGIGGCLPRPPNLYGSNLP